MGKADLHIHTSYSWDGSSTVPAVLEQVAHYTNLDVIAITDHNVIDGALEALKLAPKYGVQVIPGVEVSTAEGHLLALFVYEPVPIGLPLIDTLLYVGEMGGICVAAHPMARGVNSLSAAAITNALQHPQARQALVGIEAFNAGLLFRKSNQAAQTLASRLRLASTGSSDSHVMWTIGHAITEFAGRTPLDLRRALLEGKTQAVCQADRHIFNFMASNVSRRLMRKFGWVTWNQKPRSAFVTRRLADVQYSR